jgi:hypothetical protein
MVELIKLQSKTSFFRPSNDRLTQIVEHAAELLLAASQDELITLQSDDRLLK